MVSKFAAHGSTLGSISSSRPMKWRTPNVRMPIFCGPCSPLYGVERDYWFLSLHCYDKYVKVTFFKGGQLEPPPPEPSKYPAIRHFHVREGDELGEQFADWVRRASKLPGEKM